MQSWYAREMAEELKPCARAGQVYAVPGNPRSFGRFEAIGNLLPRRRRHAPRQSKYFHP